LCPNNVALPPLLPYTHSLISHAPHVNTFALQKVSIIKQEIKIEMQIEIAFATLLFSLFVSQKNEVTKHVLQRFEKGIENVSFYNVHVFLIFLKKRTKIRKEFGGKIEN